MIEYQIADNYLLIKNTYSIKDEQIMKNFVDFLFSQYPFLKKKIKSKAIKEAWLENIRDKV